MSKQICTCLGTCRGADKLGEGWICALQTSRPEPRAERQTPAENGVKFIVQESLQEGVWYDHPNLPEYGNEDTALRMMVYEQTATGIYRYRVIKRTESVIHSCVTCGGSGGVDSGGVTPWQSSISIPCPDCSDKTNNRQVKKVECCECGGSHEPSGARTDCIRHWKLRALQAENKLLVNKIYGTKET